MSTFRFLTRFILCLPLLLGFWSVVPAIAQDSSPQGSEKKREETATKKSNGDASDSVSRPLRFRWPKRQYRLPSGEEVSVSSIAYMIDWSTFMAEKYLDDTGSEKLKLESVKKTLRSSLELLTPAMSFNLVTYGLEQDFRSEPVLGSQDSIKEATAWLDELNTPENQPDFYQTLKSVLKDLPDAIVLVVSSAPMKSTLCPETQEFSQWLGEEVKTWIGEKEVRIDILGYGMSEEDQRFFRDFATHTNATLVHYGKPIEKENKAKNEREEELEKLKPESAEKSKEKMSEESAKSNQQE